MSITQQHTVWCDCCSDWDQITGTARQVLKAVKRQGWTRRKTADGRLEDVCPKCKDKVSDEPHPRSHRLAHSF